MSRNSKLKLINFLVALRRMPPLSTLSGDEERLLFELYRLARSREGKLSVADVYDLSVNKSASAAYRDLMGLRDKGLVEIAVDRRDKRKREIAFTQSAVDLLAKLA